MTFAVKYMLKYSVETYVSNYLCMGHEDILTVKPMPIKLLKNKNPKVCLGFLLFLDSRFFNCFTQ